MASSKVQSLRIGNGDMISNDDTQLWFGDVDPISGADQPGVFPYGKAGDIYFRSALSPLGPAMFQKIGGVWQNFTPGTPLLTTLVNNTSSPTTFLTLNGSAGQYVTIEYTIRRYTNSPTDTVLDTTRVKRGKFSVLIDPAGNFQYSSELEELGASTGVTITMTQSGANVMVQYTTTNDVGDAAFEYKLGGWA